MKLTVLIAFGILLMVINIFAQIMFFKKRKSALFLCLYAYEIVCSVGSFFMVSKYDRLDNVGKSIFPQSDYVNEWFCCFVFGVLFILSILLTTALLVISVVNSSKKTARR